MNIVTVDWDYFFPCVDWYDWGHNEDNAIFFEWIWWLRASNHHLKTGEVAFDAVRADADYLDFWGKVCVMPPIMLSITESHKDFYHVMDRGIFPSIRKREKISVWNFDAHHDAYSTDGELSCGNWVSKLFDKRYIDYHIVYPEWRKEEPDSTPVVSPITIHYGIPEEFPLLVTLLHVCRSSCWTPSWEDYKWMKFIGRWEREDVLWETKSFVDYALKPREFKRAEYKIDVKEAIEDDKITSS